MEPSFVGAGIGPSSRSPLSLVADALRRPGGRRALTVLSIVLVLAGVSLFAYPLGTDIYQRYLQSRLHDSFGNGDTAKSYQSHTFKVGQGLTRIRISRIGLDAIVVEGTTESALAAGSGHYVGTPLPGEAGNVAIAGHRTTYGHPFNRLDEVKPGDLVELDTPTTAFFYESATTFDGQVNPHAVQPTFIQVIAPPKDPTIHELTLTTCTPKGSAAQRLILRAVLVSFRPIGGGKLTPVQPGATPAPTKTPTTAPPSTLPGPK